MALNLAVGTVLGFLTGLGIGGGSLLMLWLTVVQDMPQHEARIINLLFFLPSALIACCFRRKQGTLDLKMLSPAILAGTVSAGIFSVIAGNLDSAFLRKPLGILMLFTGLRELITTKNDT